MKKIAVSTLVNAKENYGQLLQAYALQEFLKKNGYSPFLIRYRKNFTLNDEKGFRKILKFFYLLFKKTFITENKQYESNRIDSKILKRHKDFSAFYESHFKCSELFYNDISDLKANPPKADVYIAGSDQIWNWGGRYGYDPVYFLQFGGSEVKRIGYAVGMSKITDNERARKELTKYLQSFDYLALREPTGIKLLKECGFVNPQVVIDPTLLLEREDYTKLIRNSKKPEQDYMLGYFINFNNKEELDWQGVKNFLDKEKLDFKYVSSEGYMDPVEQIDEYKNELYDIQGWLEAYAHAKFILTTSYHGLIFSIIMRKPFLFLFIDDERTIPGRNRPEYILKSLGLESRIYSKNSNKSIDLSLNEPIDWASVENKLNSLKKDSIEYLLNSIEK